MGMEKYNYDPNASRKKKTQINLVLTKKEREILDRVRQRLDIPSDKGAIMTLLHFVDQGKIPQLDGVGCKTKPTGDR